MTMLLIKTANAQANPYRDFNMNPINDEGPVVANLRLSIKKNGLWTKFMARPADLKIDEATLEKMADKFGTKKVCPLVVEKWYGHNTQRAAELEGIKSILMDIRPCEDLQMMSSMAYENKMDSKENMMVMIETVNQTKDFIASTIDGMGEGDFKAYKESGGKLFTSIAQYKNVILKGVGYGSILKVLEGWQEGDIKNSLRVLKDLEAERYVREDIADMPSVGILGQYSRLVEAINVQAWPDYWKDFQIAECTIAIKDPQVSTTVKVLKNAIKAVRDKEGACDPLKYIRKNTRKVFDVVQATKDLVFENSTEGSPSLEDLPNMEGFTDYEDIQGLIAKVEESIEKTIKGREGADKDGGGGEEATPSDTGDAAKAAEEKLTAAGSAVEEALSALSELPPEGEDDVATTMPPGALAELFARNTAVMLGLADQLVEVSDRVSDDEYPDFYEAVEKSVIGSLRLATQFFTTKTVKEMIGAGLAD